MIELEALKEQLKLLGHDLPDDQIVNILKDMNIDIKTSTDVDPSGSLVNSTNAPPPRYAGAASHPNAHYDRPYDSQHDQQPRSFTLSGQGTSSPALPTLHQPQPFTSDLQPSAWQQPNGSSAHASTSYSAAPLPPPPHTSQGLHLDPSSCLSAEQSTDSHLSAQLSNIYISRPSESGYLPPHHPAPAASSSRDHAHPSSLHPDLELSFPHGFEADAAAAAAACAPKHPYEWYGQLAGAAGNPHLSLSQPKTSQRSLLHELDQSAERRTAHTAGTGAGPRAAATGLSAAGRESLQHSFWEEDEEEEEEEEEREDVRLKQVKAAFQARGGARNAAGAAGHQRRAQPGAAPPAARLVRSSILDESSDLEEAYNPGARRGGDDRSQGSDVRQVQDAGGARSGYGKPQERPGPSRGELDSRWGPGGGGGKGGLDSADRSALRAAAAAAGAGTAARSTAGAGAGAGAGRPVKYQWQEHLRSTSPSQSSVLSLPRSAASLSVTGSGAGSRASGRGGAAGPKKIDRVKRYQELQQSWNKDSFLKYAQGSKPSSSSSGGGGSARQPAGSTRKPVNFHTYFSVLHAIEAADRDQLLKETRSRTKVELRPGVTYEAPTSKRRDALRWEMRMKMQAQI